ncbi:sodium ABC transporter permease, partial [Burkholderia multivorans]
SGKAASGTEPTTSKGTAPKSLDDLDMGTTGTESADSDSTTSTSKSAASKASAAKAGTSTSAASKKTADTEADATAGLDEVPFELAEDRPNPEDLPETGLVSEFV